jgi:diguanylate cyclase (GGDEF)-like protein
LRANQARFAVLQNVQSAEAKWPDLFFYPPKGDDIYVHAAICATQGTREYLLGNYTGAIETFEHAYSWSFATGQIASAVTAAVNIGGINEVLNDHTASIEAIERALELARPTGWRLLVGPATRQRAEALCNLGQYDTAMRCAAEARVYYEHLTNSRNYGTLLITSGDIAERIGDHAQALKFYDQCAELARKLSQADLLIDGLLSAAKSYLKTQQIEKAEACASEALQVANESGVRLLQTTAVQLQAKVAKAKGDRRSELEHLLTAVSHAEALQGYLIPHEVLLELANVNAEDGRYELAYEASIKAHNAREKVLNAEASNRATAMQIRIAAERSRAELEHQRKLLAIENERASTLQTVNEKLQELTDELHLKNIELDQRSNTDRLTGLANRMRLDAVLDQELARSQRSGDPFALILLDIDKFKTVNDTYGHQVGDKVLIEVSRLLASSVRPYDVVGRWGGEEFLMVCGNTDLEGAVAIAEKLRASMASRVIDIVGIRTGSFGVGVYSSGDNIESLLSRADAALYRAKESGRNRVEC